VGGVPSKVTALIDPGNTGSPLEFAQSVAQSPAPQDVNLDFGQTFTLNSIEIDILSIGEAEPAHVHCWGVTFK
jgi:hypothetical protein